MFKWNLTSEYALLKMQTAFENGYSKIVLGTCTSRIACHVLEATVKVSTYTLKKPKGKRKRNLIEGFSTEEGLE